MECQLKILDNRLKDNFPKYATPDAAGLDLRAAIKEEILIAPNQVILIPTGIAIYLSDPNYAGLILPRSGLGHKHGIVLGNLVGLLDADYQGEIKISCWNRSNNDYLLEPLARLAQLVIIPIARIKFTEVNSFAITERNINGFGHTGTK